MKGNKEMTVYQDSKKGTWYFKKRKGDKVVTKRGFKTEASAKRAEKNLVNKKVSVKTFDDVANEYIVELSKKENETAYSYECVYNNHIKPIFGNKPIDEVIRRDIEKLQNEMFKKKHHKNKSYAKRTINQTTSTFNSIMNFAFNHEYIDKNPCAKFRSLIEIKENHEKVLYWTDKEFKKAIQFEKSYIWHTFLTLAYLTGMRKGELRALRWIDIGFENKIININTHINNKPYKGENGVKGNLVSVGRKNGGTHIIHMDRTTYELLSKLKEYDMAYDGWNEETFIFGIFKPVGAYTANRHLDKLAEQAKLPKIVVHGLRHSHVSYLISKGFSQYEIADRIGDKVDMVLNIYGHLFIENQNKIIQALDNDFDFIKSEE